MNKNVEGCNVIYSHKISQDYKLGQRKWFYRLRLV